MKRKKLRWGKGYRVAFSNRRSQAAEMVLAPGDKEGSRHHYHRGADQWLYVVSGSGTATVNGKQLDLSEGTLLLIEQGDDHEIRNDGRALLRTLNFYSPPAFKKSGDPLPRGRKA
jgi:mannose-6-phosphate isomerase-like protein (cupin superfamily)